MSVAVVRVLLLLPLVVCRVLLLKSVSRVSVGGGVILGVRACVTSGNASRRRTVILGITRLRMMRRRRRPGCYRHVHPSRMNGRRLLACVVPVALQLSRDVVPRVLSLRHSHNLHDLRGRGIVRANLLHRLNESSLHFRWPIETPAFGRPSLALHRDSGNHVSGKGECMRWHVVGCRPRWKSVCLLT